MSAYTEFFLNSRSSIVGLELIEISHSKFTQTYRVVRNAVAGVTVTLEDATSHLFSYYPLRISNNGATDDLEQSYSIDLGDLGEVLPAELDSVSSQDGFGEKPRVVYRLYRSDDLTAPLLGPVILEVQEFSFTRDGASFTAKAPSLNINKTGEVYRLERFEMLRGFL